jgi:hypothetical protein
MKLVNRKAKQKNEIVMVRERGLTGLGLGKKCGFYQLAALPIPNTEKVKVKRRNKFMEWIEITF